MLHCQNCGLKLSAMNRFFQDGEIVDRCPRCGNEQPIIPKLAATASVTKLASDDLKKLAGTWDVLKQGLISIAPAVTALGLYDLSVAYETFKKVMENMLAAQTRKSLDPFYANRKQGDLLPKGDFDPDEIIALSFQGLFGMVKTLLPACVKYAVDTGDSKPLRSVTKLVVHMRQFAAEHRNAVHPYTFDYDFMESEHNYMKQPSGYTPENAAQKGIYD